MPRLALIQDSGVAPLNEEPFLEEARLQRLLEENPELIALDEVDPGATPLIPIGSEVSLGGQALDLLFIDASGRLTAVEAKLRKNSQVRREVVGQTLEYVSYLSTWTVEDVERQAERYFSGTSTPERFKGMSLYSAMCSSASGAGAEVLPDEDEMRTRVAEKLNSKDIRAIIAVDRVVDPLRRIVTFLNGVSSVTALLLEVLEYRAPDDTRLASINVYGVSERLRTPASQRGVWDEARFLEKLRAQARSELAAAVEMLFRFIQEEADSVIWGSGLEDGSAGFGVRRGGARFKVFGVTTKGQVYMSSGALIRHVSLKERQSLVDCIRMVGVTVSDDFSSRDTWVQFDAALLGADDRLAAFKSAVLAIRDAIEDPPT